MTTEIVIRGGGWFSSAGICRSANRYGYSPSHRYSNLGFRVVKEKKVEYRVLRGGGWYCTAELCRSADRFGLLPSYRNYDRGFRVIKESKDDN